MLLIIDNYDSFTYNLLQYVAEVSSTAREIKVVRNDKITINEINELAPQHIIVSPGPCSPNEAGISLKVFSELSHAIPILGVCLGHQALGQAFGADIVRAKYPVHGKASEVYHDGRGIFDGIKSPFTATRYHSLVVDEDSLPGTLEISARCDALPGGNELPTNPQETEIMSIRHKSYPWTVGVQFHPESILTTVGKHLLSNFLTYTPEAR